MDDGDALWLLDLHDLLNAPGNGTADSEVTGPMEEPANEVPYEGLSQQSQSLFDELRSEISPSEFDDFFDDPRPEYKALVQSASVTEDTEECSGTNPCRSSKRKRTPLPEAPRKRAMRTESRETMAWVHIENLGLVFEDGVEPYHWTGAAWESEDGNPIDVETIQALASLVTITVRDGSGTQFDVTWDSEEGLYTGVDRVGDWVLPRMSRAVKALLRAPKKSQRVHLIM